jgi:membrane-bound lytic murein transglycosylase D
VTAYNHGLYGVKKAMRISGSRDIEKIIEHYSSPTFGFASQNFYAEFMAVLYIINKSSHDSQSKNVSFLSMVSKKIIDF